MARLVEKIVLAVVFLALLGFKSFSIGAGPYDAQQATAASQGKAAESNQPVVVIPQAGISAEQAKAIALSAAKGKVVEIEEKTAKGMTLYEVEVEDNELVREVKVDKWTGKILKITEEPKDEGDEEVPVEMLGTMGEGMLTEDQAKEIALEHIPGEVISFEAEKEGGRLLYEVGIATQGDIAEVEIDAETGEVIEIEWGED